MTETPPSLDRGACDQDDVGKETVDAAWYYPDPKEKAMNIKDHLAFGM